MINFFVVDAAGKAVVEALYAPGAAHGIGVELRPIDNQAPGVGLNLNDAAAGVQPGASVTLASKYVLAKRVIDDPEVQQWVPDVIPALLAYPWCTLETETVFAPLVDGA
jgi:hypothetical protein